MSRQRLDGASVERHDGYALGGFEDTGREVVKKPLKTQKDPSLKPDFFLGGSQPTRPAARKAKLRKSWIPGVEQENHNERPEPIRKPTKKWTPVGGGTKNLPPRSKSHDGTISTEGGGIRRAGKKPGLGVKKEEREENSPTTTTTTEEDASGAAEAPPDEKVPEKETPAAAVAATPNSSSGPCGKCAENDATIEQLSSEVKKQTLEIKKQAEELEQLKQDKGELARQLKKAKGLASMAEELKKEVEVLKKENATHKKAAAAPAGESKNFHKLENKLNTLKMVMDGGAKINKNNIDDMKEHVSMLEMILYQDLKKEGMKNVWV